MVQSSDILQIIPPAGVEGVFRGRARNLWGYGNRSIINRPLLGILSARQCDSDLALKSLRLVTQLASLDDLCFIGGWHSPLEQQALHTVLHREASLVICLAKALDRFTPSVEIARRVNQGKALLLTHCTSKAKRITREASLRRNELILGLAKALLVLSAPEGSASFKLANSALEMNKQVLTLEHPLNHRLVSSGALPATVANIQPLLR